MCDLGRDRIEGAPKGSGNDVVVVVGREQGELVLDAIAPVGDSHRRKVSRGVVPLRPDIPDNPWQGSVVPSASVHEELAIGVSDHSGWAIVVVAAGAPAQPRVIDRRRVELCPDELPRQVFHAAAELPLPQGEALVAKVTAAARACAARALTTLLDDLSEHAARIAGIAVRASSRDVPGELAAILASHALLHAAEGQLYQEAVAEAADDLGLRVQRFTRQGAPRPSAAIESLGKALGAPWRKDHKDACAAALSMLGAWRT